MNAIKKLHRTSKGPKENKSLECETASKDVTSMACESDMSAKIAADSAPSLANEMDCVPFIDGGVGTADAICQTDLVFLPSTPEAAAFSPPLSSVSNTCHDSTGAAVSHSSRVISANQAALASPADPTERLVSSSFDFKRNSLSIPFNHSSSDEVKKSFGKNEGGRYSSPFSYAAPYSSYAARRTSLRSPSLWLNEKLCSLPSTEDSQQVGSSPSVARKFYVTPTFGGNDQNLRGWESYKRGMNSRTQNMSGVNENRSSFSKESKSPNLSVDGSNQSDSLRSSGFICTDKASFDDSLLKSVLPERLKGDLCSDTNSLNGTEPAGKLADSLQNLNDFKLDPLVVLKRYVSRDSTMTKSSSQTVQSNPVYGINSSMRHSCNYRRVSLWDSYPPATSSLSHVTSSTSYSPSSKLVISTTCHNSTSSSQSIPSSSGMAVHSSSVTGDDVTNSNCGEQKRMSVIDGRLKLLPDQLSSCRDAVAKQPAQAKHILHSTIALQGSFYITYIIHIVYL